MARLLIYSIALLMIIPEAMAQTIERSVISNAGNTSFQTPGYQWSFTVGEPITQHFTNGTTSLTQGFQQPGEFALIISPLSYTGDLLVCGQEAEVIPPIVQQACGEVQMSWDYDDNINACGGLVSRIWTITDACGHTATWTQYYPITDPIPPIMMSEPITDYYLDCEDPLPASPLFSDNCDANPTITQNIEPIDANTSWLHYIATDDCGNSTTFTYTLHFSCCAPPVVFEPVANLVVECGTVAFVPDPVFYDPNWNDLTIEHNVFGFGSNCGSSEAHVWTATNGCGASISVNASVSYVDTQAPVYPPSTPTYYVINCMMPQPTAPVFTDNCDGALDISISSLATAENILEKTFTATDDCGNSTSVTYIIETGCCTPACPGDFNDDGVVNVSDLLIFSSMFGSSGICLSADINLDGVVNITDLLLFSSTFGTTCDTFGGSN